MGEEGKESKLDGALLYATPWNHIEAEGFAFKYGWGFYSWVVGMSVNRIVMNAVQKMKSNLPQSDYDRYMHLLTHNWTGLAPIENDVVGPMYGYKNRFDYYKDSTCV